MLLIVFCSISEGSYPCPPRSAIASPNFTGISDVSIILQPRLAQVHSLDQSTIRVIQDPIRCFLNRDPQADGKNGLVQNGPFDFQAHSFC